MEDGHAPAGQHARLSAGEHAELEALRAELKALRTEASQLRRLRARRRISWRTPVAALLIAIERALNDKITNAIVTQINVPRLTGQAATLLNQEGLARVAALLQSRSGLILNVPSADWPAYPQHTRFR
jgi:hypothetical protein